MADQLINSGKVIQGYLGVSLYPDAVSADLQKQFSLSRDSGVLVSEVIAGGPAAKAGLQQGDIIFKADGTGRHRPQHLHRDDPRHRSRAHR